MLLKEEVWNGSFAINSQISGVINVIFRIKNSNETVVTYTCQVSKIASISLENGLKIQGLQVIGDEVHFATKGQLKFRYGVDQVLEVVGGHTWPINNLRKLKNKASHFRSNSNFMECEYLYRNKPSVYWRNVQNNGTIMDTSLKEANGDPQCPINNSFKCIFFSANVNRNTGKPFWKSPFGHKRLCVPATMLLNDDMNLYFADFYCLFRAHYVTLVIAKNGSPEDHILSQRLLRLDLYNNQFLRIGHNKKVEVTISNLWVEVLYAHPLDVNAIINNGGYFRHTAVCYEGHSIPGGLPKRQDCNVCNL